MSDSQFGEKELRQALEKLVGEPCLRNCELPDAAVKALQEDGKGIGCSQLNELLLILGFDRVTRAFFQFLATGSVEYKPGATIGTFRDLNVGIDRFRELGLLAFGNIKYAFKAFSSNEELLEKRLAQIQPVDLHQFRARHDPILAITEIPPDKTYYLGYVIERQLKEKLQANPTDATALSEEGVRKSVVATGIANQEAYLVSDHLDVYVATSMRQRHEYLAVNRLTNEIFSHRELKDLKLRWFDPTQAFCADRIDKGLSEALMLRRASCTIYLAQETDTLGKDSELASTLAQGKPVIAFVPKVDDNFARRLFEDLKGTLPDRPEKLLLDQLQIFEPGSAWTDPEVQAWAANPSSIDMEAGLARLQKAMKSHYDSRAKTLQSTHPLGVQVNLETGVANGVLVIRDVEACAKLVKRILTRSLKFSVEDTETAIILREEVSGCVFRLATADKVLTNAFWNFYLDPSE